MALKSSNCPVKNTMYLFFLFSTIKPKRIKKEQRIIITNRIIKN